MKLIDVMEKSGHEQLTAFTSKDGHIRAFIAIHDTTLGPGMGGVRRWPFATEDAAIADVLRLSEAMTYKAAVAGLPFGGAKAVVWCEPDSVPSPTEAYEVGRFVDRLGGRYIAAPDVGTDERYMAWLGEATRFVAGGPVERGGTGSPSPATARGVFAGIRASIRRLDGSDSLAGKIIAVQGAGAVGTELVTWLVGAGAKVLLADLSRDRVRALAEKFPGAVTPLGVDEIVLASCDVFAPCALGGTVNEHTIPQLRCRIVAGSANNPLQHPLADAARLATRGILYAPDFVINAGGLVHVGGAWLGWSSTDIQNRIDGISETLRDIYRQAGSKGSTLDEALRVARHRLLAAESNGRSRRNMVVTTN